MSDEPTNDDKTFITVEQARELEGVAGAIGEFAQIAVDLTAKENELQEAIRELRNELPEFLPRTEALVNRRRLLASLTIAGLLTTFLAINLVDHHVEHCGPADRPDSQAEKKWCDVTFFLHEHPTESEYLKDLADRLLEEIGHDPEIVRSTTTTTTTTVPPPPPVQRTPTTARRTTTTVRRTPTTARPAARPPAPPGTTTTSCERLPNGKCKSEKDPK